MFTAFTTKLRSLSSRATLFACSAALAALPACSDNADEETSVQPNMPGELSFFVSSSTQDGNLGGLEGADAICENLARDVGAGDKTWRAYLSAENGGNPVHARDRIGAGPWYNALGTMLAANLEELHGLSGDPELFVDENGARINGQWNGSNGMNGNPVNEHDIMTGSDPMGMLLVDAEQTTCNDWTTNALTPGPRVGHSDGMGPMMDTSMIRFTSWGGGHAARGCAGPELAVSGSTGRIYCFAAN